MIAYHGCDAATAERLLHVRFFKKSQNDYDWLGERSYFLEYGADRALQFANDQQRRGRLERPRSSGPRLRRQAKGSRACCANYGRLLRHAIALVSAIA